MQELVRKGWAIVSETSDYSFQLTGTLLNMMPVQFALQTPFKVFQRRPDIALTDATMFELVLEVQHLGFKHTARKGHKHEMSAYFAKGFLPVVQFVLFGLMFGHFQGFEFELHILIRKSRRKASIVLSILPCFACDLPLSKTIQTHSIVVGQWQASRNAHGL